MVGIRQSDPLFSFLFFVVVDVFSKLAIGMDKIKGLIEGFHMGKERACFSHL